MCGGADGCGGVAAQNEPGFEGLQDVCFGSIPSAFWWVLVTMTTVGYGDCFPISIPGKMFGVFVMFCGVITVALPITVLGELCLTPPSRCE